MPEIVRKTVLITGGSSGIGAATAARLSARGYRVFSANRVAPQDQKTVEWIHMDVRDEHCVRGAVATALSRTRTLDAVVCNAGYAIFGSVEEVSIEQAQAQFETNFFGVIRVLAAVLPSMRTAGHGRIIVMGSLSGRAPIPFQSHYSASKAALDALARSLRNEVSEYGVHVSLIEAGDINTALNERADWTALQESAYGEAISRCAVTIRTALPKAPGPELVAAAIERALTARRPRMRYTVGPDSLLVPFATRVFPESLCLRLIKQRFLR